MSMKCRCGSDDKIIFIDDIATRAVDNKQHICLGAKHAPTAEEIGINPTKQEEHAADATKGKIKNQIREAYRYIKLIETTLLEEDIEVYDGKLQTNLPKLGMVVKMVDNIIRGKTNDL